MPRSALTLILKARASSPVLALLVLAFVLPTAAQKHPFTFEDMMKLKRVEEPVVSPDGKWVLFAAVDVDLQANTKTPHVWIVPLNQAQDPPTTPNGSQANHSTSAGMTERKEREIISDQDADRPRWRRMGSGSRLYRRKRMDRRYGSRSLTPGPEQLPESIA